MPPPEKLPHFNKGKVRSKELRARISATLKAKGGNKTTYKKGHKFSGETLDKMREVQKGYKWTDERKSKISGENSYRWKGGISKEENYQREYHKVRKEKQAGRKVPDQCEICCVLSKDLKKRLCYDHCHETGEFRGWICSPCNTALGMVRDNTEVLKAMIKYLETWRDND